MAAVVAVEAVVKAVVRGVSGGGDDGDRVFFTFPIKVSTERLTCTNKKLANV